MTETTAAAAELAPVLPAPETDRRIDPQAPPIASWREERFLTEVARAVLLGGLLPKMVAQWAAAGIAPQKATERADASPAVPSTPRQGKRTSDARSERERASWRRCRGSRPDGCEPDAEIWSDRCSGRIRADR
jgi:hypothetical protein